VGGGVLPTPLRLAYTPHPYMVSSMSESTYTVTGMSCDHCVRAVTGEVASLPGVTSVDVDLASGRVTVTSDQPLDDEAVQAAVEEAGYEVTA
jgi:copper chaperone